MIWPNDQNLTNSLQNQNILADTPPVTGCSVWVTAVTTPEADFFENDFALPTSEYSGTAVIHLTSSFQCSFESRLASFSPWSISGTLVTLSKKPAGIVIYVCGHTLKWRGKIKTDLKIEAMCQNCWVWCIFVVGRGRRENCWESVETMHEGGELLSHLLLSCNTGCERNWQCDCSNSTTETETCVFPIVCGKRCLNKLEYKLFTLFYKYTKSV